MREPLKIFADEMEERLLEKDIKYPFGWKDETDEYLLSRLEDKFEELRLACRQGYPSPHAVRVATDVANFAMMIADNKRGKD